MKDISFFDRTIHHQTIDSTFTEAKKLIAARRGEGNFVVIAEHQTEGVGRKGNVWHSPEGGLWFTAGLYNIPIKNCITIFTALMIVRAITKLYPACDDYIGIKWPNDIVLDGEKMGGILTSNFPLLKYVLIGVGINTNNSDFPEGLEATSLDLFLKDNNPRKRKLPPIDHHSLLNEIFNQFGEQLPALIEADLEPFMNDYYLYSILEGKSVTLATEFQDFKGKVKGITNEGALLLQLSNGSIQPFLSGSVIGGYK